MQDKIAARIAELEKSLAGWVQAREEANAQMQRHSGALEELRALLAPAEQPAKAEQGA